MRVWFLFVALVPACGRAEHPHPTCDIPQLNCDAEFSYDTQKMGGGFSGFGVSFNANTEKAALRQVDQEVQNYAAASRRLCDEYNKCVIDKETYATRSENLRRRLAKVPELFDAVKGASSEEERRKALAKAYQDLVPVEKRSDLEIRLSVLAERPGEPRAPIRSGAPLPTGTKVSFSLSSNKPTYFYLFQRGPSGEMNVLFPDPRIAESNPVSGGIRIPNGDRTFRLNDKDLGTERVYVVGSLRKLDALEQKGGGGTLASVARASKPSCTRALELEGPAASCARTRGLELDSEGTSLRAEAEAADDTIVQVFEFEHTK